MGENCDSPVHTASFKYVQKCAQTMVDAVDT